MLRSLKFVRKLGVAGGPQRLVLHRVGSLNAAETRIRSDGHYCLEDAPVVVACTTAHQQRRNYVTNAATKQNEPIPASAQGDVFTAVDRNIKWNGRVFLDDVNNILQTARTAGTMASSQALLLIRCCGDFLVNETIESRREVTAKSWQTIKDLGTPLDVSHYNAYILVNLENETDLSPVNILLEMKENNIEPNRVTFQRLIEYYCSKGDIAGATKILEHMNEQGLPLNEIVFSSLIKGHAISGDFPSAMKILDIMKDAGVEPSSLTYTSIICAHARKGDMGSIKKVLKECKRKEITLSDEEILEVIYTLANSNFPDLADKMIPELPKQRNHTSAVISYISKFLHKNQTAIAFKLQKTLKSFQNGRENVKYYFIRKLVAGSEDVNEIIKYCKLIDGENPSKLLSDAVYTAFSKDRLFLALPLLKAWKESGGQIREICFYPIFVSYLRKGDEQGILKTVKMMISNYKIMPLVNTLRSYVVPHMTGDLKQKTQTLQNLGVHFRVSDTAVLCQPIKEGKLKEAADFISSIDTACFPQPVILDLVNGFQINQDVKSLVEIVHHQCWVRANANTITREILNTSRENERLGSAPWFSGNALHLVLEQLEKSQIGNASAILKGFVERGMRIDPTFGESIKRLLINQDLDATLINLVSELMSENLTLELYPLNVETPQVKVQRQSNEEDVEMMQKIQGLIKSNELDEVETLLTELESRNPTYNFGFCCTLISFYSRSKNLEKADEWFGRLKSYWTSDHLVVSKNLALRYSHLLLEHDRVDDALKILKLPVYDEIKSGNFLSSNTIQLVADKHPERLEEFFNVLKSKQFFTIENPPLISRVIGVFLSMNEIQKAFKVFEWACKNINATPAVGYLMKKLIELENAQLLREVTKLYTKVHGENNALLHLAISFAECNRPRQAKKILQVPGAKFSWAPLMGHVNYLKEQGNFKALENVLQASTGIFRDLTPIYTLLLDGYGSQGDWKKCLSLWIQMQENDVQPTPEFLEKLEQILVAGNQQVPFTRT